MDPKLIQRAELIRAKLNAILEESMALMNEIKDDSTQPEDDITEVSDALSDISDLESVASNEIPYDDDEVEEPWSLFGFCCGRKSQ